MFWPRADLPNVEGVAGEMQVTGHGYVAYTLRTETGRLLVLLLCARLVPGIQFELISEYDLVKEGLKISKDEDNSGLVVSSVVHKESGEIAKLVAYRKLFCIRNVSIDESQLDLTYRRARTIDEVQTGPRASMACKTLDLKALEVKMGFLHASDSPKPNGSLSYLLILC